jgi:hypothetical protein
MRDHIFGWSYPPGAQYDPSAPYNQTDYDDDDEDDFDPSDPTDEDYVPDHINYEVIDEA